MTQLFPHIWAGNDLSEAEFMAITEFLHERCDFNLGQYKDRCVRRRIVKRLRCCQAPDFSSYLKRLETDREELDLLLATISIHVSQFFRNPDTFRILEQNILPDLCRTAHAAGHTELTLWSAGCASGEEAYSLALLIDDMAPEVKDIRILGTDISDQVLEVARIGLFDASRLSEVPSAAIAKYFSCEEGRYRLSDRVRDKVTFLRHNIVTAGEFPRADLILCRNVLIYFTRPEQERILSRFTAALPERGVLVLGRSETMAENVRRYYQPEYPVERIYRRTAEPFTEPVV